MKKFTFLLALLACVITTNAQEFCQTFNKVQIYDSITKSYSKEIDNDVFGIVNLESRVLRIGAINGLKEVYSIQNIMLPKDTLIMQCVNSGNNKKTTFKIYKQSSSVRIMESYTSTKSKTKYISIISAMAFPIPKKK